MTAGPDWQELPGSWFRFDADGNALTVNTYPAGSGYHAAIVTRSQHASETFPSAAAARDWADQASERVLDGGRL